MSNRKEQSADIKKIRLGLIGERIVAKLLRDQGHIVDESLDPFDVEKDMIMDGNPIEVKTQVPLLTEDSFAIGVSQIPKIRRSHRVFFVSVPPTKAADPMAGSIYVLDSTGEFKAHRKTVGQGREMLCIPRTQPAMQIIARVEDKNLLSIMQSLSTSAF